MSFTPHILFKRPSFAFFIFFLTSLFSHSSMDAERNISLKIKPLSVCIFLALSLCSLYGETQFTIVIYPFTLNNLATSEILLTFSFLSSFEYPKSLYYFQNTSLILFAIDRLLR
jgi:hypothetical protein